MQSIRLLLASSLAQEWVQESSFEALIRMNRVAIHFSKVDKDNKYTYETYSKTISTLLSAMELVQEDMSNPNYLHKLFIAKMEETRWRSKMREILQTLSSTTECRMS